MNVCKFLSYFISCFLSEAQKKKKKKRTKTKDKKKKNQNMYEK